MSRWLPRHTLTALTFAAFAALLGAGGPVVGEDVRPPDPPQWVGARVRQGAVWLTWVRGPAARSVRVYRRAEGAPGFARLGETTDNVYTDFGARPGATYAYQLRAVGPAGIEGAGSMEIRVRVVEARLRPPTPPAWEGSLPLEEGGVGLRWTERAGEDILTYNVYRREPPDPGHVLIGSTESTRFRDPGAEPGHVYAYALTVLDSALRETERSEELLVRVAPVADREAPAGWRVRRTRAVAVVTAAEGAPLLRPADVAAGPRSGSFYLADSGRRRIFAFSRDGAFRGALGGGGEFLNVLGVSVDAAENLYASDAGRSVVQVFGPTGRFGRRIEVAPPGPGRRAGIIDAAGGGDGRIYVVDNRGGRLLSYGAEEEPRLVAGSGGAPGLLSAPTFCALDKDGSLYVADALGGRVQVYDRTGQFVRSFGEYRRRPGGLGRPKGVAVSPEGEVYVADSWLNLVQVFDRTGAFVAVLGDEEGRPLDLGSPNGVALDAAGRTVAIAERLSARLQIREIIR